MASFAEPPLPSISDGEAAPELAVSRDHRHTTASGALRRSKEEHDPLAMAASTALRRMMAQDPVLSACAVLSVIGLGAPLIVPPIRNAMNRPEPIVPPKLADVVEGMTGNPRN